MKHPYHCAVCGTQMNESGMGTLICPKCETGAVPTIDPEGCVSIHFVVTYEELLKKQDKLGIGIKQQTRTAYVDWTCPKEGCRIPGMFDSSAYLEGDGDSRIMICQRCGTKQTVRLTETSVGYGIPEICREDEEKP